MACEQRRNHGENYGAISKPMIIKPRELPLKRKTAFPERMYYTQLFHRVCLGSPSPFSYRKVAAAIFLSEQWWWCSVTAVKWCDSAVNCSSVQGWHNLMPSWEWGREGAAWRDNKKQWWEMLFQAHSYNQAKNWQWVITLFKQPCSGFPNNYSGYIFGMCKCAILTF